MHSYCIGRILYRYFVFKVAVWAHVHEKVAVIGIFINPKV